MSVGRVVMSHMLPHRRVKVVEEAVVGRMKALLPAQTDESLQDAFGISWNTWCKVRAGQPIRLSTALRLENRMAGNDAAPAAARTASAPSSCQEMRP